MGWKELSALKCVHTIEANGLDVIIRTSDGQTGDRHEFHMTEASIRATLQSGGSSVAIWATEPTLPSDKYDPSVGVAGRMFRIEISRSQAEFLRDTLIAELKRAPGKRRARVSR